MELTVEFVCCNGGELMSQSFSVAFTEFEKITGQIEDVQLLKQQGWTSEVRKVIAKNGTYLLKSSFKEKYRAWLKKEAEILETLLGSELAVPKYYSYLAESHQNHLLMSFEQGISLTTALQEVATEKEKQALARSFGQFLHELHEKLPISAFQREGKWLEQQLIQAQYYAENGQCDGDLHLLDELKANKPFPVKQTMIHGDCTTDNVLVIDGEVQLFIDVAGMAIGDPRYDEALAISKLKKHTDLIDAFYEGYERNRMSEKEFVYFNDGLYEFF